MAAAIALSTHQAASAAEVKHSIHPENGAESWEVRNRGIYLLFAQILPDQVRGFYLARGFGPDAVEHLARRHCVFQTILRNEGIDAPVRFEMRSWRARTPDRTVGPRVVEDWLPEWERRGVQPKARLAFRWALFPSEHAYRKGDWNMGMTILPLPLGTQFDLEVIWSVGGKSQSLRVPGVRCATEAPGA